MGTAFPLPGKQSSNPGSLLGYGHGRQECSLGVVLNNWAIFPDPVLHFSEKPSKAGLEATLHLQNRKASLWR